MAGTLSSAPSIVSFRGSKGEQCEEVPKEGMYDLCCDMPWCLFQRDLFSSLDLCTF